MKLILIVEDKETSRELLRTVLENQGYQVEEAENGEQALQRVRSAIPDLVLLDLQLPLRDGYEVLREFRKNPAMAKTPVVAVTANAMQGDRERALEAGFTSYIAKPVALAHLREEVTRLLGNNK